MPIASINNIKIYYEQYGAGPDLILIGGLSTNHMMWEAMLGELAKNYRVTIFDNRGAGLSSQPKLSYSAEMLADDTVQLMDYLNIRQAHIVGHSMGGIILQAIMVNHSHRVLSGVVASSSYNFPTNSKKYFTFVSSLLEMETDPEKMFNINLPWLYGPSFVENIENVNSEYNRILGNPYAQTIEGYYGQINALNTFDYSRKLNDIKAQVLILSGDEDIISPLSHQFRFEELINQSELKIIKDCGHMIYRECPERFTAEIMNFCN